MKNRSPRWPTPAMMVSLLALFVSLGGAGYAAVKVGSAQIIDNSIRGKDIRNHSLTGKDVKNDALGNRQIANGALQAATAENAANAAALGGVGANAFVKQGAAAGGALSGTFPSPGFAKQVLPLTLKTDWQVVSDFGNPAVWKDAYNVVHFRGAIANPGHTNNNPFDLAPEFRPATEQDALVEIHAGVGFLTFHPNGTVNVSPLTAGSAPGDIVNIGEATFEAGV